MSDDMIAIIGCCILGLMAHGARRLHWMEWVLRVTYGLFLLCESINLLNEPPPVGDTFWSYTILLITTVSTGLLLFKPGRQFFSLAFTSINQIIAGRVFLAAMGKLQIPVPPPKPIKPITPITFISPAVDAANANDVEQKQQETVANVESSVSLSVAPEPQAAHQAPPALVEPLGSHESAPTSADAPGAHESAPAFTNTSGSSPNSAQAFAKPSTGTPAPVAESVDGLAPVLWQKATIMQSFLAERVFVPESIPHMNGLWIYVTCLAFLLAHTEMAGFQMPAIMIPIPVTFDQLFSYNFLGLVFLAVCGAGIFVTRKPLETLRRLGLVKPTLTQVLIGIGGIFVTFAYDYIWSTFTHSQDGLGYADKLSHYNEGTFTGGAAPGPAFLVASTTGLCAGLGEETLIRGALQPVFGIIPAAFMHGALHGQFSHAPLLILQVFGWSMMMGILRRYTNTTTTIITHVGFNFLSTFLIAFNP